MSLFSRWYHLQCKFFHVMCQFFCYYYYDIHIQHDENRSNWWKFRLLSLYCTKIYSFRNENVWMDWLKVCFRTCLPCSEWISVCLMFVICCSRNYIFFICMREYENSTKREFFKRKSSSINCQNLERKKVTRTFKLHFDWDASVVEFSFQSTHLLYCKMPAKQPASQPTIRMHFFQFSKHA